MSNRSALAVWLCIGLLASFAVAGQPRAATTTQRAVVSDKAFAETAPAATQPAVAAALSATVVNANFSNTPAMQAFADLAKQTGYKIEMYDNSQPRRFGNVTYKASAQPFWLVMREICTRANVGLYMWGGDEDRQRIPILPSNYGNQEMMKAAASIMGPYMTVITYLTRVNTVNLAHPERTDRRIQIQMIVYAEPKAVPTQAAWEATVDEAVDDNGNSMMPTDQRGNQRNMQGDRGVSFQSTLNLPYPESNPGKHIARLRGHIAAMVALGSEPIEIPDPLKAAELTKTIGGQRLAFKSLKKAENAGQGQYELELVFYRDGKDPQAFNALWQESPDLKLTDAKGTTFRFGGGGGRGDQDSITRSFRFYNRDGGAGAAGAPTRLVITVPSATQDVNVPFELVDLPLP